MRRHLSLLGGSAGIGLTAPGCGGALDPSGEGAARISDLWWVMLGVTLVPLAIVLVLLALAVRRRRPERARSRLSDRRVIILGGVVLPLLVLAPIIGMTLSTSRALGFEDGEDALTIEVTAHQFWWDLRYPEPGSSRPTDEQSFRTANEVHIPVGRTVELRLTSEDVIHSFWIPELHGKMDLVPGRENTFRIRASQPGVYRGQCAEFCGLGHAFMRLLVVAQPEDEFQAWWRREAGPAAADLEIGDKQEFANSCAPCHTVRGLFDDAAFEGDFGPDLTHLAGRRMIGANVLPNTREALGRWIVDPQGVKPGNRMPDVGLEGDQLDPLLDFLLDLE